MKRHTYTICFFYNSPIYSTYPPPKPMCAVMLLLLLPHFTPPHSPTPKSNVCQHPNSLEQPSARHLTSSHTHTSHTSNTSHKLTHTHLHFVVVVISQRCRFGLEPVLLNVCAPPFKTIHTRFHFTQTNHYSHSQCSSAAHARLTRAPPQAHPRAHHSSPHPLTTPPTTAIARTPLPSHMCVQMCWGWLCC